METVDQPPGTGFSYIATDDYAKTVKEVQAHLLEFMKNFYQVFPEFQYADVRSHLPSLVIYLLIFFQTYLAGESFAGQWIPYFADALLDSTLGVPLRGIAIGNGWMDSKRQYLSYLDYSVKMGLLEENSADWKNVKKETERCEAEIEKIKDEPIKIKACERVIMGVINKKVAECVSTFLESNGQVFD